MVTIEELRIKEVININNGQRMGFIEDIEVNLEKNRVEAVIVPSEGKLLKFFNRDSDYIVYWKQIVKIGQDVILVDIKQGENRYVDKNINPHNSNGDHID